MNASFSMEDYDLASITPKDEYGYYCDIEVHRPPRVFITQHKYEFRVVQLPELPPQTRRPSSPPIPNRELILNRQPIWKQWISRYWNALIPRQMWKTTTFVCIMVLVCCI